ncbi:MAG TPA: hypothetical protein VIU61_22385 [Kofleriaceae bacterium]
MEPKDLASKAGQTLFAAEQWLASAIVYAETAKIAFDDPMVQLGLGAAVENSAGVLVVEPFVHWATRALNRCVILAASTQFGEVAMSRLGQLRANKHYKDLPALEPGDLDPLLQFLDIDPMIVPVSIGKCPADDHMFLVMALGELRAPRFAPVIAMAASGAWGAATARAALKRIGAFAGHPGVQSAVAGLRASPLAEECEPYLGFAESTIARRADSN